MNVGLNCEFQAVEVQRALQQMDPLIAPGPYGMSPIFYKSFWHIVGEDISATVLATLNGGIVLDSIYSTFTSLIPKIKNPKKVSDFRHFSLCNIFYELIAKVFVNRLKLVLPHVVSDSQTTFLFSCLITDNVLVAFETLHYLKRESQVKLSYMALKLNMSKAYDRIKWKFLEKIMRHLGFSGKIRTTIMSCIRSVSYVVLLNGESVRHIKPGRALQ